MPQQRRWMRQLFLSCLIFSTSIACAHESLITEPEAGPAPLINAIAHAHNSIDLVIYGFTDQQFAAELIHAQQLGKNLRVLIQQHPYMTDSENQAIIAVLQNANVPMVFADPNFKLTHQKTFILDNQTALVMTFNLTHSTFKKERNFALQIDDPAELQEIAAVFAADWRHQPISVHQPDLIWSPDNSREKLLKLIHDSRHDLKVYAESITDYDIVGALAGAARNGINVEILTSNESKKVNGKKFHFMEKAGAKIRISKTLIIHAKVMLIDNQTTVLGSINMTKPSIDSNRELAVISHDDKIYQQVDKTFEQDWEDASDDHSAKGFTKSKTPDYAASVRQLIKLLKQQQHYSHGKKHHHYTSIH